MPIGGQIVSSGNTLTAGIRNNFWDAYYGYGKVVADQVDRMMERNFTSDKLTEIYAYYQSSPHWKQWIRGNDRVTKGFKSVQFSVSNKDWEAGVPFHENDEEDDQTKSLIPMARETGEKAAILDTRVMFQIMAAGTDSELLETLPNAPDGVALYSALDGASAARFNVSGGNILSGAGTGSGAAIRADLLDALSRFLAFCDTEGKPLFSKSLLDQGVTIYYASTLLQEFAEAFQQGRTVQATSSGQASTGAAVTNVIMDAGWKVTLVPTAYLSGSDWYIVLDGARHKPLFKQNRRPIREVIETMDNSDVARRTKIKSIMWDARWGFGVGPAFTTIKVDN